jgi:GNAT superfamily N-acetyltransferase
MLDRLTAYSLAVDGVAKPANGAAKILNDAPSDVSLDAKHSFEIMLGNEPIGLADVINGYPLRDVATLGLLAIAEDLHGLGYGRAGYRALESYVGLNLPVRILRIGVVTTNPVQAFWEKMGFSPTGEVRPFQGEARSAFVILMEKALPSRDGICTVQKN